MSVRAIFIRTLCERTLGQNPVSHWKLLLQVRGASNDTRGKKRPEIQLSCGKKERLPLLFFFFSCNKLDHVLDTYSSTGPVVLQETLRHSGVVAEWGHRRGLWREALSLLYLSQELMFRTRSSQGTKIALESSSSSSHRGSGVSQKMKV